MASFCSRSCWVHWEESTGSAKVLPEEKRLTRSLASECTCGPESSLVGKIDGIQGVGKIKLKEKLFKAGIQVYSHRTKTSISQNISTFNVRSPQHPWPFSQTTPTAYSQVWYRLMECRPFPACQWDSFYKPPLIIFSPDAAHNVVYDPVTDLY